MNDIKECFASEKYDLAAAGAAGGLEWSCCVGTTQLDKTACAGACRGRNEESHT
jgi:hypothetical protein